MKSKITNLIAFIGLCLTINLLALGGHAQTSRKSVSGAEVTGTFRYNFPGRYKGTSNVIKIIALGGGKLKMGFDLLYPYTMADGGVMVNTGTDYGTADIVGDTAIFTSDETPECRIQIKFVRPGAIKVTHKTPVSSCGYGMNVWANGTYRKISGKKPTITAER